MRSLVLGGSVFVGRHLVERLCADGGQVTVLNRGRTPSELPPGVERLVADRTDVPALRSALGHAEWDVVFDVSGFVMAAGGVDTRAFLDLFDGRTGRYVYVSSIMAYDQALVGLVPWSEEMPTNPSGPETYGGFKAAVESALLGRWHDHGFPATVVRPAAVYGPDNNIFDMETPMWLRLLQHRPVLLPHGGLVTGSYGHVDDLCGAMVVMATSPAAPGEVFNVTADAVTSRRYVDVLAGIVGVEADVVDIVDRELAALPKPPFGHLFGRAHHAVLSCEKARRLLGYTPSRNFRTGHTETFTWFMQKGWNLLADPMTDLLWNATWDFEWEEEVARRLGTRVG